MSVTGQRCKMDGVSAMVRLSYILATSVFLADILSYGDCQDDIGEPCMIPVSTETAAI